MPATREIRLSGGPLEVRDTGAVAGGPTIVFLHGLLVDGTLWDDVVAAVSPWARCVVPNLPLGSHRLPMDERADLSPPGVADLVAELLEAMDLDQVVLVGNDTGGAIAQLVVTRRPERVGRLVLTPCDAFDEFPPAKFRHLPLVARLPGGVTAFLQPTRLRALHATPLAYGLLSRRPIARDRTTAWLAPALSDARIRRDLGKALRGISKAQTQAAAEALTRFDRPALVVWAAEDRVFAREHGPRLAALLPQGRLEVVGDAGTFVALDQPERLAALLQRFVREPARADP